MKYIVYLTTNKINKKIYIGVHATETPEKFDGYYGDGVSRKHPILHPKTPFQYAIKKYGYDAFERSTIKIFDSYEEAFKLERELVNEDFIKRIDTYNVILREISTSRIKLTGAIHQYSLEGNYIQSFKDIKEVELKFGENMRGINPSIREGRAYKNFLWLRGEKQEFVKPIKKTKGIARKVGQYTLEGELIKIYNSVREARKDFSAVDKMLRGERNHINGFIFKYED